MTSKRYDINELNKFPDYIAVPYIEDTEKACIHIKQGTFEDVVFIIKKAVLEDEFGKPVFDISFEVIDFNRKLTTEFQSFEDIESDSQFMTIAAAITNDLLKSSFERAFLETERARKEAEEAKKSKRKKNGTGKKRARKQPESDDRYEQDRAVDSGSNTPS